MISWLYNICLFVLPKEVAMIQIFRDIIASSFFFTCVYFFPGDSIFKVHFFTPNFSPPGAGGCYNTMMCQCHGEHVTHHNPPLLFDLHLDPSESTPLTPETEPRYAEILKQTAEAVERHKDTFKHEEMKKASSDANGVQNQLTWEKVLWRPWLQPCCGTFPFCGCKENTTHI